jgi:hypothetical protein
MGSDPKPDDRILVLNAQYTPADTYTDRIYFVFLADFFEMEARVIWMFLPYFIASAGTTLDMIGKALKTF